jgi:hypothetical protein
LMLISPTPVMVATSRGHHHVDKRVVHRRNVVYTNLLKWSKLLDA